MRFCSRFRSLAFSMPAALLGAFAALTIAPAQAAVTIIIDKSSQSMTVEADGRTLYNWTVSTGKAGHGTPSGSFRAFRMEIDHYSKQWDDAPMPHSIFFTQYGHAIHGTFDEKRLGMPASHGCVRLQRDNAATLFSLVKAHGVLNTRVVINGEAPSSAPAVARRQRDDDLSTGSLPRNQRTYARTQPGTTDSYGSGYGSGSGRVIQRGDGSTYLPPRYFRDPPLTYGDQIRRDEALARGQRPRVYYYRATPDGGMVPRGWY